MEPRTRDDAAADPAALCSLPPASLPERMRWIRRELLPHALESQRLPRGIAFELAADPGVADKLDRLIELERQCCSGIDFARVQSDGAGRLRLEVRGVDPDAAIFRSLELSPATPPRRGRLWQALGIGTLSSFLLCCVLPIAALALLGGAAAPLLSLDAPLPIALGALIGAGLAWWWIGA